MLNAELRLACDGRTEEGFSFCCGMDNLVLDLCEATNSTLEYLDKVTNIFNEKCFNYNKIASTLFKLHSEGLISEKKYNIIYDFHTLHRKCGLYLYCKLR